MGGMDRFERSVAGQLRETERFLPFRILIPHDTYLKWQIDDDDVSF